MSYYRSGDQIYFEPKGSKYAWKYEPLKGLVPIRTLDVRYEELKEDIRPVSEDAFAADANIKSNNLLMWYKTAILMAKERHSGQTDKAGNDYFKSHVQIVASMAQKLFPGVAEIVAYLHDILEDTSTTREELESKFPPEIVEAVVVLTRNRGEDYLDYIRRIKNNSLATKVKICDLASNMDISRIENPTEEDWKRIEKYRRAFVELMN